MSKIVATLVVVAMLFVASPAVAGVGDLVKGVNGVVTSPLDIVHGLVEPVRLVDVGKLHPKLDVVNVVTDRIGGVGVGVVNSVKRVVLGLVDVVTFLATEKVKGPFSPDLKYSVLDAVAAPVADLVAPDSSE